MGEQEDVWVVRMVVGEQAAMTDVMVGETGGIPPPPALLLLQPLRSTNTSAAKTRDAGFHPLHKEQCSFPTRGIRQPFNGVCKQEYSGGLAFPGILYLL